MSKTGPHPDVKAFVDYRLNTSIDCYVFLKAKGYIGFNCKSGRRERWGVIWRWLCLAWSSDIGEHSTEAKALAGLGLLTLLVTFLG